MLEKAKTVSEALTIIADQMDSADYRVDEAGVEPAALREASALIDALTSDLSILRERIARLWMSGGHQTWCGLFGEKVGWDDAPIRKVEPFMIAFTQRLQEQLSDPAGLREQERMASMMRRAIDAENEANRLKCALRDETRRLSDVRAERDDKTILLSQRRDRVDELLTSNNELRDRAMKAEAALAELKSKEPDYYWLRDDSETGADDPLCIADYQELLEPFGLMTSFNGPDLWGVGHEDADGGFFCTTFRSLEDAERFCAEKRAAKEKVEALDA